MSHHATGNSLAEDDSVAVGHSVGRQRHPWLWFGKDKVLPEGLGAVLRKGKEDESTLSRD